MAVNNQKRGEDNPNSKLSSADLILIEDAITERRRLIEEEKWLLLRLDKVRRDKKELGTASLAKKFECSQHLINSFFSEERN